MVCVDQPLAAGMVAEINTSSIDHAQRRRRVEYLVRDKFVIVDADGKVGVAAKGNLERQAGIGAEGMGDADVLVLDDRAPVRRAFGQAHLRT